MKTSAIGRRYAKALLELAEEQKLAPKVQTELEHLVASWNESKELRDVFENPAITSDLRVKVLEGLAMRMGLSKPTTSIVKLLAERRRMRHLPEVAEAYFAFAQASAGAVVAEVTSATELASAYYVRLQQALEKNLGKKVTIVKKQDPTLIAGVVTRVGDKVFDGSLKSGLEQLEETLLA